MSSREPGRPPYPDVLTPAEWRVVDAVRHGLSRRAIARRRGISLDGVRYHLRSIEQKLGVDGMAGIREWEGYPMTTDIAQEAMDAPAPVTLGPIAQISLFVRSVPAAVAFYSETLGFPHLFTAGDLAFHDIHGVRLYLHQAAEGEWRPSSVLYFSVDDISATYRDVQAAGVTTSGAPHHIYTDASGTQEWMLFFDDPDGNTLAAVARIARA